MGVCLIIRTSGGTDTSGATATAARVLSGYTCYVNDVKITGTMTNQGTKTASLNAGGSYTIPAGYHSGSGKVTANALSGQTSGTATAARILSGRTAWVNGSKLTGSMTNRGAISQKLAANGSYTVPAGWHNGSGKVTQSLTTQGAKNVTPKTINQTACAASRWTTGSIIIVGSSYLKAENIKKGVKIFNVTGTLDYAEYFTGTAGSMLSRWFIVRGRSIDNDDDRMPKFITNGQSLGLPTNNALRIKFSDFQTGFCIRIPNYTDYHDVPHGGEFKIWVVSPTSITSSYMPLIDVRFNTILRFASAYNTDLDSWAIGSIHVPNRGGSSTYKLNTKYSSGSISAKTTTELSNRSISSNGFDAVNNQYKFSGYAEIGISYNGSTGTYRDNFVYITKITYHPG